MKTLLLQSNNHNGILFWSNIFELKMVSNFNKILLELVLV